MGPIHPIYSVRDKCKVDAEVIDVRTTDGAKGPRYQLVGRHPHDGTTVTTFCSETVAEDFKKQLEILPHGLAAEGITILEDTAEQPAPDHIPESTAEIMSADGTPMEDIVEEYIEDPIIGSVTEGTLTTVSEAEEVEVLAAEGPNPEAYDPLTESPVEESPLDEGPSPETFDAQGSNTVWLVNSCMDGLWEEAELHRDQSKARARLEEFIKDLGGDPKDAEHNHWAGDDGFRQALMYQVTIQEAEEFGGFDVSLSNYTPVDSVTVEAPIGHGVTQNLGAEEMTKCPECDSRVQYTQGWIECPNEECEWIGADYEWRGAETWRKPKPPNPSHETDCECDECDPTKGCVCCYPDGAGDCEYEAETFGVAGIDVQLPSQILVETPDSDQLVVPDPDLFPQGGGRVLGQQSGKVNATPLHAEDEDYGSLIINLDGGWSIGNPDDLLILPLKGKEGKWVSMSDSQFIEDNLGEIQAGLQEGNLGDWIKKIDGDDKAALVKSLKSCIKDLNKSKNDQDWRDKFLDSGNEAAFDSQMNLQIEIANDLLKELKSSSPKDVATKLGKSWDESDEERQHAIYTINELTEIYSYAAEDDEYDDESRYERADVDRYEYERGKEAGENESATPAFFKNKRVLVPTAVIAGLGLAYLTKPELFKGAFGSIADALDRMKGDNSTDTDES